MTQRLLALPDPREFRGALVDTNLLLLLAAGELVPERIAQLPRLEGFLPEHHRALNDYVRRFRRRVTTPHVLTEVSNLARQWPEPLRSDAFGHFASQWKTLRERHSPAAKLAGDRAFVALGLADIGILHAAANRLLVLTMDRDLTGELTARRIASINWRDFMNW